MRGFYVRADFATIARIDATVAYLARALLAMGDTSNLDVRRTKAVLIMANPTQAVKILQAYAAWQRQPDPSETTDADPDTEATTLTPERFDPTAAAELLDEAKLLPTVWLFAHLAAGPTDSPVGRVEGADPVTAEWVRRTSATGAGSRSPRSSTRWTRSRSMPTRSRTDIDKPCTCSPRPTPSRSPANTTREMQIDHTIAWTPERAAAGAKQSRIGNYGPMVGLHHRIKTHGRWQVRQPFPGVYLWRDPYGATYLVDHTGTRRLPPAHAQTQLALAAGSTARRDSPSPASRHTRSSAACLSLAGSDAVRRAWHRLTVLVEELGQPFRKPVAGVCEVDADRLVDDGVRVSVQQFRDR